MKIFGVIATLAWIVGVGGCLAVLGWQAYDFLVTGKWTGVSIIDGLKLIDFEWADDPWTLHHLHRILDFFNLGVAILFASIVLAAWAGSLAEDQ